MDIYKTKICFYTKVFKQIKVQNKKYLIYTDSFFIKKILKVNIKK